MNCTIDSCERPAARAGLCWAHVKRRQEKRPLDSPLADTQARSGEHEMTPLERLEKTALDLADAEEDEDYERARERLRKLVDLEGRRKAKMRIQAALDAAKKRGVHVGRPPSVTAEAVLRAIEEFKTKAAAGRALGVSRFVVARAVRKARNGE